MYCCVLVDNRKNKKIVIDLIDTNLASLYNIYVKKKKRKQIIEMCNKY